MFKYIVQFAGDDKFFIGFHTPKASCIRWKKRASI
jgi:hypothetical protein